MKKIFEPIQIGKLTIKNRLVVSAMLTNLVAEDGSATEAYIAYHEAKAKGGWGLIITEDYMIAPNVGTGKTVAAIYNQELAESHKKLTERIHAADGTIFAQIYHAGRETHSGITGEQPVAPSAVKDPTMPEIPRELTKGEIEIIIEQFAQSAYYVKQAGFDGVEIHGASGYLVGEFLSPFSNKRTDEYGGTITNRAKFAVDIVKAIRTKVGTDFPISFRLCTAEYVEGGQSIEESKTIARMLEQAGVDVLHCTQGIYASRPVITPPYMIPHANFVDNAAEIKKVVSIPVIAVGGINDPELAETVLLSEKADMITMARASLADPELPNKARNGELEKIIHCIGCVQGCQGEIGQGKHIRCLMNPCTGMETEYDFSETLDKKTVYIAGGGISGCSAAIAAARKGHHVVLFERSDKLGGQWNLAAVPLGKSEFASLVSWQRQELWNLGVEIRLNMELTKTIVEQKQPDFILIATGSQAVLPPIPGLQQGIASGLVVTAHDVLAGKELVQGRVAVIGGGLVGAETAEWLASENCNVTLIEMQQEIVKDGVGNPRMLLVQSLQNHGVNIMVGTKVLALHQDVLQIMRGQEEQQLDQLDKIVLAVGVKSVRPLAEDLAEYRGAMKLIGDANGTKNGYRNIQESFEAGLSI